MRRPANNSGFSAIELLIVIVVVGLLGFVGYTVYNHQNNKNTDSTNTKSQTTSTSSDVPVAPQINSTSDLDKATTELDQTDTGSNSDSSALDSQLNSFQ